MTETMPGLPAQIFAELRDNPAVRQLETGKGPLPLASLAEEAVILSTFYRLHPQPILVVKKNLYSAQKLYERVSSLLSEKECALFSADESLRVEAIAASPEIRAAKVETLASLLEQPNQLVITCPSGYLRLLPSPEVFRDACITLKTGMRMDMEELKRRLRQGGYYQTAHIDQPLSFAARGGIVDIYSINYDQPVRVEFFDDEIDSIRFFDAGTQKTIVPADEVRIVPASDILFSEEDIETLRKESERLLADGSDMLRSAVETEFSLIENRISEPSLYTWMALTEQPASLVSYMNHPLVIHSDPVVIQENVRRLIEETTAYIQEMVQEDKKLPRYAVWHEFQRVHGTNPLIEEDPFEDNISGIEEVHLPNHPLHTLLRLLQNGQEKRTALLLRENELERVLSACVDGQIPYVLIPDETTPLQEGLNIMLRPLAEGFRLVEKDLAVVTSAELFEVHHHAGRYEKKFRNAEVIQGYEELEPGDYVVHAQYGVGQYLGIETREIQGIIRDFLKIIYRGNAELLVPLEQFRLVRKFVSREGVVPRLNKLGSGEWEKTRARLEENVNNIAERLVDLYAVRTDNIGHAFQPDSDLQRQFEREFEYELTPDQEQAVRDVKKDMESDKPMDRLVCGDVGFGKTEIAIRASFKAAAENKQVAVLCPTTILAEQHFRTFSKRYENYPFTIRCLDRFVTPAMQKQTLQDLKEGRVDILIGTHRILSNDVVFKDLGLLVVDEEQRFGVEHKEKIKEMKNSIDVLTLSATPIPRTLQMSLVGIRQLSQLETPPSNRYNVQTYVVEKNLGLVSDAIEKELSRNGQVFYLYNNIDEIYNVARTLQNRVPDASIGVVHGRMDREAIEDVMMSFVNRELNVLVCTTIIENGIDIPNANTILIDNAQNFGLAQIYQIKGRVGRSDRVAYAYLLVPPRRQLSETATKRLQAVKEFARLGSGYKIAMRDLTIRGAGDLLGPNQSGFIDTVGIDMYVEMLEEAIAARRGQVRRKPEAKKLANVGRTSYIPRQFAPDDYDKLSMYQQIDLLESLNALEQYRRNVVDQYGRLPEEVEGLFEKKQLDILLNEGDVDSYREVKDHCEITFAKEFSQQLDGVKLFSLYSKLSRDIALRYTNSRIIASVPKTKDSLNMVIRAIETAREAKR